MREATAIDRLAGECSTLTRYLTGRAAPAPVVRAYQRAHALCDLDTSTGSLDAALVRLARAGPVYARGADALASVCFRGGALRRKIVLLVAILESFRDTADLIDTADGRSAASFIGRTVWAGAISVVAAVAAGLMIGPLAAWLAIGGGAPRARAMDGSR
jgi:hypothetical protein